MTAPTRKEAPFFVGYLPTPKALRPFLALATLLGFGLALGAGLALATAERDPGLGRFAWDLRYQTLTGVLETRPAPVLRLPPDAENPEGRAIMLVGQGKAPIRADLAALDGKLVDAGGIFVMRGAVQMLQVGGKVRLRPAEAPTPAQAAYRPAPGVDLGRHELRGEIVDSKCYLGAMRPGDGKAHLGCAHLCILGDIPPALVIRQPDGGAQILLLADAEGGDLVRQARQHLSYPVKVAGQVERRGDLLVLKVAAGGIKRL